PTRRRTGGHDERFAIARGERSGRSTAAASEAPRAVARSIARPERTGPATAPAPQGPQSAKGAPPGTTMKDDDNLQNPHLSSMASGPDDLGRIFRLPVSSRLAASGITDRIPLPSCYNTSRLGAGTGTAARP